MKAFISIILSLFMINTSVFAAGFVDTKDHWAENTIKRPCIYYRDVKITWYHSASRSLHRMRLINFAAGDSPWLKKFQRYNGRNRCAY